MFQLYIKEVRKKRRLTQKELAKRCGLTQSYISQLESNLRVTSPTLQTIELIAEALEICPYILISYDCDKCNVVKVKENDVAKCKKETEQEAIRLHRKTG